MSKEWQPIIKKPYLYLRGVEEVIPKASGWSDSAIRQWCSELVEFITSIADPIDFPALSSTTILKRSEDRSSTFFKMRYAKLASPGVLEKAPISLVNIVANYTGLVAVSAQDVTEHLKGAGTKPVAVSQSNHRRIEAFVTNPTIGEMGDWHRDERLTLPLYLQPDQIVVISHLANPRHEEDLYEAPVTVVEPSYGQFLAFDGVTHPHRGLARSSFHGDRVVMGVLYDLQGNHVHGPKIDDLV